MAATIGMILPSFCIIFAISKGLDHFPAITWIAHAFQGIKIAVGISSIILRITALLRTVLKNKYVQDVLRGLKPCTR